MFLQSRGPITAQQTTAEGSAYTTLLTDSFLSSAQVRTKWHGADPDAPLGVPYSLSTEHRRVRRISRASGAQILAKAASQPFRPALFSESAQTSDIPSPP